MATSTKQSSQAAPKPRQYKTGSLYISEDGCIYLNTDEESFVMVFNSRVGLIGGLFQVLEAEETLEPFIGSVTLTEGL